MKTFFVVIGFSADFTTRYETAWRRLSKNEFLVLLVREGFESESEPQKWEAKIVGYPKGVTALDDHPVENHEVVLYVRRPFNNKFVPTTFGDRSAANQAWKEGREH